MKTCLITERRSQFPIGPEGQFDTNDVNIAAALGADQHFFMGEEDLQIFAAYDMLLVKMSKVKESYDTSWMGFVPKIRQRYPSKLILMYQEAEVDWPLKRPYQDQVELYNAINQCDVFLAHNSKDSHFYSLVKRDRKVIHVPTPLPIQRIKEMRISYEERQKGAEIIFGSSFDDRAHGLFGYLVAAQLLRTGYSYKLVQYARSVYADDRNNALKECFGIPFETLPYMSWLDFCARSSKAYVSMNLMPAAAAGRDTIMFASLGIPHIGNRQLDPMNNCFPDLAVDVLDTDTAIELLEKLLYDEGFYKKISQFATEQVEKYHTIPAVREHLRSALNTIAGINI